MASNRVGKTNCTRLLHLFLCPTAFNQYIRHYNGGTDREKLHILNILGPADLRSRLTRYATRNHLDDFSDANHRVDV